VLDTAEESFDSAPTHQVESVAGVEKYAIGGIAIPMERLNAEEATVKAIEAPTPTMIEAKTTNTNFMRCLRIRCITNSLPISSANQRARDLS
jgi:hypothetical protein